MARGEGGGRPPLEIDASEVRKLASIGCKNEEIADWFGCSVDTITRRFAEELRKGRANVRISLRRIQLRLAEKNATMAIWLGKQMLGQRDTEVLNAELSAKDNKLVIEFGQKDDLPEQS